ncbi:hypothetical protein ACFFNY_09455 [Paenibacillus hodogayensis]|uniref:Uncharacterized protein n=1 Tax=Paenibacillus hodogayensis TaxID=279208 RepID=A0ABV5VU28_9BACL
MTNNRRWKPALAAVIVSAALLGSVLPASAEYAPTATAAAYTLSSTIRAELKTAAVSKGSAGTQLAVVVRLRNDGGTLVRVPDFELRAVSADGLEYTLPASSANARSLMGKESAELSYLITIDRPGDIVWTALKFVDVDEYVYPKLESTLLTMPLSRVWNSAKADFDQPLEPTAWGTPFTLPGVDSAIAYTPIGYTEHNGPEGHAHVVTLSARNTGTVADTVDAFRLDGKAGDKVYPGQRVEKEPITLAAGEQKYVHMAIPSDPGTALDSLLLMTTGTFSAGPQASTFDAAALKVAVPAGGTAEPVATTENYAIGQPIAFDPLSKLIDTNTEVSLAELHMHENDGAGFKSVIAKFKIRNKGSATVSLPAFGAEIVGSGGAAYTGTRQTMTTTSMMPDLSYVVSYSFMVPATEDGERFAIRLLDNQTTAPYGSAIASIRTKVQTESESDTLSFYPYNVKIDYWTVNGMYNAATGYSYRMKLDIGLERVEDVVVDQNFSKMKIELTDSLGRAIGSETIPFTGTNKLISGQQDITFANLHTDTYQYPLIVKVYETIDTPNGEASRLVKTLK